MSDAAAAAQLSLSDWAAAAEIDGILEPFTFLATQVQAESIVMDSFVLVFTWTLKKMFKLEGVGATRKSAKAMLCVDINANPSVDST